MKMLFDRVDSPLAAYDNPGCRLASRRPVTIDGTCQDPADIQADTAFVGCPGVNNGERCAFAQARGEAILASTSAHLPVCTLHASLMPVQR